MPSVLPCVNWKEPDIVRHQRRDKSGRITDTEHVICEQPQPDMSQPDAATNTENPDMVRPDMVRPDMEKPAELNRETNTEKSITYGSSTIPPFRETATARPPERKGKGCDVCQR